MDARGVGNGAALLLGSSNYKRELSTLIYVHDVLVKRVFEYQSLILDYIITLES